MKLRPSEKYKINQLAGIFYQMHGCKVKIGYDFSKSEHPQEKSMWRMALYSYKHWILQNDN